MALNIFYLRTVSFVLVIIGSEFFPLTQLLMMMIEDESPASPSGCNRNERYSCDIPFREIQFTSQSFLFLIAIAIETFLLFFRFLPDAPVCITDKIVIVGAYRSENLNVVCEVHSDPPPRSFKWKFNSSGESFELPKERHYKNGSLSSVLRYTPIMDQDYGTLTCQGQNEVGEQLSACVFQVILAGKKKTMTLNFHRSLDHT